MKRLLKNFSWNVIGGGGGRILNLIAMILLGRIIGLEDFGYFSFIQTTIGALGILSGTSLGSLAIRQISLHRNHDAVRTGRILGLLLLVITALTTAMVLATVMMAGGLARSLTIEDAQRVTLAIQIAALTLAVTAVRGLQDSILSGFDGFREAAKLKLLEGLTVVTFVPLIATHQGLIGGVIGMLLSQVVPFVIGVSLIVQKIRTHGVEIRLKDASLEAPLIYRYGLPTFLSGVLTIPVLWYAQLYLGRHEGGVTQISLFNAAYQWYGPLLFTPLMMNSAAIPVLTQLWSAGDRASFRSTLIRLILVAASISAIPALALALASERVTMLYGVDFAEASLVLVVLALAAPLAAVARLCSTVIETTGHTWVSFMSNLLGAMTLVVTNLFLAPPYGAAGLALSVLAGSALQLAVQLSWLIRKNYG